MTDEEILFYCGNLMAAAHHLSIGIMETSKDGMYSFCWRDHMGQVNIQAGSSPIRKEALYIACQQLADYLNVPKGDPTQSKYKF